MDINVLVARFCDDARYIRNFSPATIRRYKNALSRFIAHARITQIEEATPANVRSLFFDGRTTRGWKVATYLTYQKSLSAFFKWCIKEGHIGANPIAGLETPRLEKRIPRKLTQQDSFRLLEVVQNYPYEFEYLRVRNHAVFATFIFTGIRRQELLNLKLTDVDVANSTLFVHAGKGNKDRIVPLANSLVDILMQYLTERRKLGRTCPEFFTSRANNIGLTSSALRRMITDIRQASGLAFSAHTLRHTFATLMLEGGCDIYSLSRMMGHSEITTTTIYLAASAEHLRSQIGKHPLNQ